MRGALDTLGSETVQLNVRFSGQRSSQYQYESPATIKVEGTFDLSKLTEDMALLLGLTSRH